MEVPFVDRPLPEWYDDAKLGIFIHWGPYAVPCYAPVDQDMGELFAARDWAEVFRWSPYTEWYLNSMSLQGSATAQHHAMRYGDVEYAHFVAEFRGRAAGASVADWVPLLAAAGARYIVPVTKHHDGFLMWRSSTPHPRRKGWMAERDHIGELATATIAAGLRLGLYYSGGLDWTFEPPPITDLASMFAHIPSTPEYAEYVTAHVDELVDRFRPAVLWNDIGWPPHLDPNATFARYYEQVPDGVVNDRWNMLAVMRGELHADIATPEYSTTSTGERKWEVCRGIGRSFGYNRAERDDTLTAVDDLIWMLADIVGRGGNLLLNVGPAADGQIPLAQVVRLTALGWWLRVNGAAIHGTRPWRGGVATTTDGRDVRCTISGDTVHAIVRGAPDTEVRLPDIDPVDGAEVRMLGNDRALPWKIRDGALAIELPDHLPASPATAFSISGTR